MKEHGSKLPAEQPAKILKSLLKKPGQSKARSQKNRVVINEKLNEFFAADYIILIKEECCTDYEEDCDCCCQEHEFLRLGNCKECRAELNRHFGISDEDSRYRNTLERDDDVTFSGDGIRGKGCESDRFRCGPDLHAEDAEEEEEEEEEEEAEEEEDEDDEEEREEEEDEEEVEEDGQLEDEDDEEDVDEVEYNVEVQRECCEEEARTRHRKKGRKSESKQQREIGKPTKEDSREKKKVPRHTTTNVEPSAKELPSQELSTERPRTPPPPPPPRHHQQSLERDTTMYSSQVPTQEHQQQETLSPPEGYKDVCSNGEVAERAPRSSLDHVRCRRPPGESGAA